MVIVVCSPDAISPDVSGHEELVQILSNAKKDNNPVALLSNGAAPSWFDGCFGGTGVQFIQQRGRQNGEVIRINAEKLGLKPHDALVLATKQEDMQMGKNGGAVLVAAGWSTDSGVQKLGIRVNTPAEFAMVLKLTSEWPGHWWFEGAGPRYQVKALADLSTYGQGLSQQEFGSKVKTTVKQGGGRLNALLVITARSLLIDSIGSGRDWVFGVYPSSSSSNDDNEVLSDFTHRLRTTASRVRFAKRGEPLFIRHTPSPKRSSSAGGNRENPSSQIETIHLNPYYQENDRLKGRHVVVVDDCATYGVSFGVAAALLLKAGASEVTGIALGKFGNTLKCYNIEVTSNPFEPVTSDGYSVIAYQPFPSATSSEIQNTLRSLIP